MIGGLLLSIARLPAQELPSSVALTRSLGLQARVVWVDATANLSWLIDREKVRSFVRNCREVGFNTLVLDVKPISGHVLYPSRIAPPLRSWRGIQVPEGFDILQTFLEEAQPLGLEVHAALNALAEGHKQFGTGPAYEKPEWQMVAYTGKRTLSLPNGERFELSRFDLPPPEDGIAAYLRSPAPPPPAGRRWAYALLDESLRVVGVVDGQFVSEWLEPPEGGWLLVSDGKAAADFEKLATLGVQLRLEVAPTFQRIADSDTEGTAVFVNPLHPEVRTRLLALIREVVENYPVDGIVLDRLRWANVYTDFSEASRAAFEARYGKVQHFPEDILNIPLLPRQPGIFGPRFGQWVQFRAEVIRDLLKEIRQQIETIRPIPIGVYVGSWFPTYYEVGVHWGSDRIENPYRFTGLDYRFASYTALLDYLIAGCYYPVAFMRDAPLYDTDEMRTVEGAARQSLEWVAGDTFLYTGLYLLDYRNNPVEFERALRAALSCSQGVMIFEASMLIDWNWWDILERVFSNPTPPPPHRFPSLLESLRREGNSS